MWGGSSRVVGTGNSSAAAAAEVPTTEGRACSERSRANGPPRICAARRCISGRSLSSPESSSSCEAEAVGGGLARICLEADTTCRVSENKRSHQSFHRVCQPHGLSPNENETRGDKTSVDFLSRSSEYNSPQGRAGWQLSSSAGRHQLSPSRSQPRRRRAASRCRQSSSRRLWQLLSQRLQPGPRSHRRSPAGCRSLHSLRERFRPPPADCWMHFSLCSRRSPVPCDARTGAE